MTNYDHIITFGETGDYAVFLLSSINETSQPSTLKTNLGKTYIAKQIPLRNAPDDLVLSIEGVITGEDRSSTQTKEERIQWVKDKLIYYNDGYKHTYTDGVHSIYAVIQKGSLVFKNETRQSNQPLKFSIIFEQWQ